MAGMDGPTLAQEVRSRLPNAKIIFISGYAEDSFRSKLRGCLKSKGYGKSIGKFFSEGAYRDGIPERLAG